MEFHAIDCEKGEGIDLAKQFKIKGYPTYIVYTPDGKGKIDHWLGFDDGPGWSAYVEADIADPTVVADRTARFEAEPTARDAKVLARVSDAESRYADAANYFRTAQRLDPAAADELAFPLFDTILSGHKAGAFELADALSAADAVIERENADPAEAIFVQLMLSGLLKESADAELKTKYLKAAVRLSERSDDPQVLKYRPRILVDYALQVDGDKEKALGLKRDLLPEGWKDDAGELNGFAWWCFENNINLAEAEQLARRGVELAEPGRQKASILDTLAEICNARGLCGEAVRLAKLSVEEAPDNKYYQGQVERFEKLLQKGAN